MTQKPTPEEFIEKLRENYKSEYFNDYILAFRNYLNETKEETNASLEEIHRGLGLSKQIVINFLKGKTSNMLPIGRADVITLWETLTNEDIYKPLAGFRERKRLLPDHHLARKKLRAKGYNDLLITAGFHPKNTSNLDEIPKKKIERMYNIITRLSKDYISDSLVWKIEDIISEQILNDQIGRAHV